jgi:hypothetical protein
MWQAAACLLTLTRSSKVVIRDPKHPERADLLERVGWEFDPDWMNIAAYK